MLANRLMMGAAGNDLTALIKNGQLNTDAWEVVNASAAGTVAAVNGKLRVSIPSTANDEYIYIDSKFKLSGDCVAQINYDVVSSDPPSSSVTYPFNFRIKDSKSSEIFSRVDVGGVYRIDANGTDTTSTPSGEYVSSGKLKLTRNDGDRTGYYWDSGRWEWAGSTGGFSFDETTTDNVTIRLLVRADYDSGVTTDFSNLLVSGDIVWP